MDVKVNKDNIDIETHRAVERWAKRISRRVDSAHREGREEVVKAWFKLFKYKGNPKTMLNATKYWNEMHWQGNDICWVVSYSGVSIDDYKPPKSLERQRRLGKYQDIEDSRAFVLDLQLNQGILGLPEFFTHRNGRQVSPYRNPYFGGKRTGLTSYLKNTENLSKIHGGIKNECLHCTKH